MIWPALAVGALGLIVGLVVALVVPHMVLRRRAEVAGVSYDDVQLRAVAAVSAVDLAVSTLTTGELEVVTIKPFDPDDERNLRWFAGALGHASDDAVGRAVAKLSRRWRISDLQTEPGLGFSGSVDRHPVRIGSPEWLGVTMEVHPPEGSAETTIGVEVDARALGTITLRDALRDDASDAVSELRSLGVEASVLPDERPAPARAIADRVGLPMADPADDVRALLPTSGPALADASGLHVAGGVVHLSDPGIGSVASALTLARAGLSLRRTCLTAGALVVLAGVVVAGILWGL